MNQPFVVERVALHFVDRRLDGPRFSTGEVDFNAFQDEVDRDALRQFFGGHIEKAWEAVEGRRTLAASFLPGSPLPDIFELITADPTQFFAQSRRLSQRLHEVSKGLTTSPGLLMVLWFGRLDEPQRFLGLFKMDPGPSTKIILQSNNAGAALLGLAVRHIEESLPDPGEHVLKWAIVPHPTRPTLDVKAKDQEGGSDPAQYFINFLGCERRPSAREQLTGLLKATRTYAQAHHAAEDWEPAVRDLEMELAQSPLLTADVVLDSIQALNTFQGFDATAFQDTLRQNEALELDAGGPELRRLQVEYRLPSGISIRGPRSVVESLVHLADDENGVIFTIATPSYQKRYV